MIKTKNRHISNNLYEKKWKKVFKFDEEFIKNYNEDSTERYILEADVEYFKDLHNLHSNLPFLPQIEN